MFDDSKLKTIKKFKSFLLGSLKFFRLSYFKNLLIFTDVTEMHKAEIADENEELKHYIQCYDHMFVRAHGRLSNLRQQYEESKQHRPHNRYPLLKEMVKAVIKDKRLLPGGFDEFYCASSI